MTVNANMSDLTIIIPAYNEERVIIEAIKQVRSKNKKAKIIIINDGSTDKTLSKLATLEKDTLLSVITHQKNRGHGAAVKTGFKATDTPFVGFIDADLTYDPGDFPKLLAFMKENSLDCIWANRLKGKVNKMSLLRKIGNRMLLLSFLIFAQARVGDATSGHRIFRTSILDSLDYESLPDSMDFITGLTKRIITRSLKYATLPTNYKERGGFSKLHVVRDFLHMFKNIVFEK